MNNCTTCTHSIWCPTWAEWKCVTRKKRYDKPVEDCADYKKRGSTDEMKPCQCADCLAQGGEE